MSEVDHTKDAINQCVPDCDQRVDRANDQPGHSKPDPGVWAIDCLNDKHLIQSPDNECHKQDPDDQLGNLVTAESSSGADGDGLLHNGFFLLKSSRTRTGAQIEELAEWSPAHPASCGSSDVRDQACGAIPHRPRKPRPSRRIRRSQPCCTALLPES